MANERKPTGLALIEIAVQPTFAVIKDGKITGKLVADVATISAEGWARWRADGYEQAVRDLARQQFGE